MAIGFVSTVDHQVKSSSPELGLVKDLEHTGHIPSNAVASKNASLLHPVTLGAFES